MLGRGDKDIGDERICEQARQWTDAGQLGEEIARLQ
jgi:hypothetical protein